MGFVCEWEVFEIIEKTFLRGDTIPPAAQGELGLLLLVPGWAGPAKPHTAHLPCNRHGHEVHEMALCAHMEILREIRQDLWR